MNVVSLNKLTLILLLIPLLCFSQQGTIYSIDLIEFKKRVINKSVTLIDVRTKREYNSGYIGEAINISIRNKRRFKKQIETINKAEPVYVYCYSGVRSSRASKILKNKGFKFIYDFKGGWKAWNKQLALKK